MHRGVCLICLCVEEFAHRSFLRHINLKDHVFFPCEHACLTLTIRQTKNLCNAQQYALISIKGMGDRLIATVAFPID